MTAMHTIDDCKTELTLLLGEERTGRLEPYLDDFSKIASLMTDVESCRPYLARLSAQLSILCQERKMIAKAAVPGEARSALKTKTYRHKGVSESTTVVKHKKVFTDFFRDWENQHGFNKGVAQVEGGRPSRPTQMISLPARPPTLTEFVAPADFRKFLLKHGYHWKDAGVGGSHGEFTHRIHWYVICEYAMATPNWLTHTPVALFRLCGEPDTFFPYGDKGVWDYLVDSGSMNLFPASLRDTGAINPNHNQPNYFRCPETLHSYLCSNENRSSVDLWCLSYLIWGRAAKRRFVGAQRTTEDLQRYIQKHDRKGNLTVVGFKTGEGVDTHGTIMWKN